MFRLPIAALALWLAGEPISVRQAEKCQVTGSVTSSEYKKMGGALDRAIAHALSSPGRSRVGTSVSKERKFVFPLEPGDYELQVTGNGCRGATFRPVNKKFTVKKGDAKLDLGEIDLPISDNTKLYGKPAPELAGAAAWKNTKPLTIQSLRGRVVLLEFRNYATSLPLKPALAKLAEKSKDRGLVVLTVHDASVNTMEELDKKVGDRLKMLAPFATALDRKGPKGVFRSYGIATTPSLILIDAEGKVVRRFFHAGDPELEKEILKQLAPKK